MSASSVSFLDGLVRLVVFACGLAGFGMAFVGCQTFTDGLEPHATRFLYHCADGSGQIKQILQFPAGFDCVSCVEVMYTSNAELADTVTTWIVTGKEAQELCHPSP